MRTSEQLYHQVRWDPRFDPARFTFGLLQRGAAPKRVPLPSFVPGGDIPWHRVLFVEADGELVWDRATGVDRIDGSRAGRVREELLLGAPFFTARTAHAWDPSSGSWRPGGVPPAAAAPSTRVRLLTWNTLWDRYDAPLIATDRRRPMLLADLAEADADVIALQEVEPALLALLLAAPWARSGYAVGTDPQGPDVRDTGLLILSRLPVREAGAHHFAPHKAVAAVTVDTAAGPLVVAGTHLTSDHTADGAALRTAQLAALTEGLVGVADTAAAGVVLLGDFNDGRSGAEGPAAALGLRDAWTETHGASDDTPTFDPGANPLAAVGSLTGRAGRLDRILLGPDGGPRVTQCALRGTAPGPEGLFVSDHFGVEATLEYGGPGARPAPLDVPATSRTAVAWLPPKDPAVSEPGAETGAHGSGGVLRPAPVGLLFGFVPESSFEEALPFLAAAVTGVEPFAARLEAVPGSARRENAEWGDAAEWEDAAEWGDPVAGPGGNASWRELRRALVERFPGCRGPAEGRPPRPATGRARDVRRAAREFVPPPGDGRLVRVSSLAVLSRRGDGPMEVRATVELGTGTVRWEDPAPGAVPLPVGPEEEATAREVTARIAAALPEGVVRVAGSRRMGCALTGADLDLVVALPGTADASTVRARVAAALPTARRPREVTGARVPGLRLRVSGLDVDLVVVSGGALDPREAVARRAEWGEAASVALSAPSDADAVREAVGAERADAFAALAREVKAWARARGLDSAPFGGLPGLAWAVLAARTVSGAGDLAPGALRREFFGTWAAWDWAEPVHLDPGSAARPGPRPAARPDPAPGLTGSAAAPAPVTVLTPSAPVRGCTGQVGPGMRDLLVQELYRAWELLEEDPDGLGRVLAAPPLHRRHAAWAVVTVRGAAPAEFEENLGRTRGRLRALLGALADAGLGQAHAWPRPFERSAAVARYAVGLGPTPPDAAALAALTTPWAAGLAGTEVTRVAGGELPDPGAW
ncbi:poly(A) polymerase [Streptomyces sp. NPDC087917]|uniref:poly(A) polymerase n=1 Tax=Streptomyces sp. NPDC087917 TaxID=3155060 RepID=UPI00344A1877